MPGMDNQKCYLKEGLIMVDLSPNKAQEGSMTAKLAAALRAIESKKPEGERIIYDPFASHFAGEEGKELAERLEKKQPGVHLTHVARTWPLEEHMKTRVREEVRQVVILGAGYDSSALRLEELKQRAKVFEIDEPTMIRLKQQKVRELIGTLPPHVSYVAIDFEKETLEDLKKKLRENGYNLNEKAVFILGGVVMYLTESAVDNLFRFIATSSAKGSSVAFTHMDLDKVKSSSEIPNEIAQLGEPFKFGMPPENLEKYLRDRGYSRISYLSVQEIKERFGKNSIPVDSNYFIVIAFVEG
jgi:methyltransferase (TIGR00027 family)